MDYIFRWLTLRFLTGQQGVLFDNLRPRALVTAQPANVSLEPTTADHFQAAQGPSAATPIHAADALAGLIDLGDAPTCSFCGSIMTRNGSCYRCMSCGSTSGCS
jgi:ribonucleoside-diphosphate reductase alpha chain